MTYNLKEYQIENLIAKAIQTQGAAYAPYSGFLVGAALLCETGEIYTGCNVENASYPAGNCAERTALFKAVSEGKRAFRALAVVGGRPGEKPQECVPCGICRQVLAEFVTEHFSVILAKGKADYRLVSMGELLPLQFSCNNLQ